MSTGRRGVSQRTVRWGGTLLPQSGNRAGDGMARFVSEEKLPDGLFLPFTNLLLVTCRTVGGVSFDTK